MEVLVEIRKNLRALGMVREGLAVFKAGERNPLGLVAQGEGLGGFFSFFCWSWNVAREPDKPRYFICWTVLPSSDPRTDHKFWTRRIRGLMAAMASQCAR